jgi:hypothetical protein
MPLNIRTLYRRPLLNPRKLYLNVGGGRVIEDPTREVREAVIIGPPGPLRDVDLADDILSFITNLDEALNV